MQRLGRLALLACLAFLAAWVAVLGRPAIDRIRRSFRTSSAPGVGVYDLAASVFLGGYYDDVAADGAAALADTGTASILEIGPGPGHLAERLLELLPDVRWTGLDIDPTMLDAARRRLERAGDVDRASFVEGDVVALPFDDGSFDLVLSSFSAHHWPDAAAGFGEIRRVLRPGGTALVYDLPEAWGRTETGSRGIGAARAVFAEPRIGRMRGVGPLTLVSRVELRRPA